MNSCLKPKSKAHLWKQTQAKFIHTCHHCGIVGHIRPNCCHLKSQRAWNKKDALRKKKDVVESSMSKYVPPHRRQPSQRFVPTCYHCGKIGHIQSSCFKLKPREHKNDSLYLRNSYEGLCNMMMVVLTRLDKLDKSHKIEPSAKKAWVRKVDTIYPLRGSDGSLT
jgi:hypothetical protein